MRILVVSDIHNDVENLLRFHDKLEELEFDVIVCPGDITDETLPMGFERADIARIVIDELRMFGKPLLVVPGNLDGEVLKLLEEFGVSLHGRGKLIGGVGFYGYGGAKTPFDTSLEPSESELEAGLNQGFEQVRDAELRVQVTHAPPARTRLDVIFSGAHVGSEVVRKFIEARRPVVAISAHIHEARGLDELAGAKLINSGRFPEGYCGLIRIEADGVEAEIVNLA